MATITEDFLKNARGQQLKTYQILPPQGIPPRAVVRHHHGIGDHAMRNEEYFKLLASEGYAVFSFDAHGHGRSEPFEEHLRVAIRKFDHVVDDSCLHLNAVVKPFMASTCPDVPLFLSGSSMGASVTILSALRSDVGKVDGIVLNASAIDANRTLVQKIQEPFAALANALVPCMPIVPGMDATKFIRDPKELEIRREDPLLYRGNLKVCSACSMLDAFKRIREQERSLSVPILALHGAKDEVCPLSFTQRLVNNCSSTDKTLTVFDEALHDTFHDYEKHDFFGAILSWLEQRSRAKP